MQKIIDDGHGQAKRLLAEHRPKLDALVAALLQRDTLNEDEILEATGLPPTPELLNRPLAA